MKFVKAGKVEEFQNKRFKRLNIMARKLAVFREPDGSFFAIEVACKHQNWDLTTGTIEDHIATCPRHQWKYDLRTGQCLTHNSTPLRRYAVKVEGEDVYVSLHPLDSSPEALN
jgi:nitrite reductase/ring-hydroxylating ferredoxin subunit